MLNRAAPDQADAAPHPAPAGQSQRLRQIIAAALLALAVAAATNLARGRGSNVALVVLAALLLLAALGLVWCGRQPLGAALTLATLTALAFAIAWFNRGAHDTAMLALPALLIVAGMFGPPRVLLALLGLMLAATTLLVGAELEGWRAAPAPPQNLSTIVDVAAVLLVTAFSIWLLTGDLRRALRALAHENARVRSSELALAHAADHDALTGLPNRRLARDRFNQALAQAGRQGRRCAALFLDLDQFKTLNDSLGHAAGDALLCQVGERLRGLLRSGDTVCRLGGDEFLVLACGLDGPDAAAAVAGKLLDGLAQPFTVQGVEVRTAASIGVAVCPDDGSHFDSVLKSVDIAMYQAKDAGGHAFRFFDAQMNAGVLEHTALLAGMRSGLALGQFALHYQPKIRLASGHVVGAEALLRWQHPSLGAVPPVRFIPVAERSGFIVELGAWVVQEACRQAAAWGDRLDADFHVSVNLSPVQFRRGDIEQLLLTALQTHGLPARRLELELTESMMLEDSRGLHGTLARLRALGLGFAIDDFGTGYSNLGYLKRFEVGRLKIDQSFVRRLTQDPQDQAIVGAIVQMASRLGLTTVAEGVEDAPTLALLRDLGCDEGQGYHWSPALPAAVFAERWLAPAAHALPAPSD